MWKRESVYVCHCVVSECKVRVIKECLVLKHTPS